MRQLWGELCVCLFLANVFGLTLASVKKIPFPSLVVIQGVVLLGAGSHHLGADGAGVQVVVHLGHNYCTIALLSIQSD